MIRENKTADNTIRWLILAGELAAMNMALYVMVHIYMSMEHDVPPHCKRLMVLMSLVYLLCESQGRSRASSRFVRGDQLLKNMIANTLSFITISWLVMWVLRWPLMTWNFLVPFYGFIIVFVFTFRYIARRVVKSYRKQGRNSISVLFVGNIEICSELYHNMESDPTTGYKVIGYFAQTPKTNVTEKGYLGTEEEVESYLEENGHCVHNLYCMLPSSENPLINRIMRTCDQQLIRYNHIPDSFNYQRHMMAFSLMANTPVFTIHYEPLSFIGNRILKRCFDLVFSGLFLVLAFPWIYLIFGYLIKKSSPGPIFFKQKRSGLEGKEFYCYKFRSMKVNANSDTLQATKDDPRKTKIGEFMRKTNIDELPQFINVFKGDMSVVGPRPHMVKHTEQYSELIHNYMVRHFAKPGITGMAQVSGFRGETKQLWQMEERVKKDVWYIEHWSFALDLFIIWKTIANALKGEENAY